MKRFFRITLWLIIPAAVLYGGLWMSPYRTSLPGYHSLFYSPEAYRQECAALQKQAKTAGGRKKARLLQEAVSQKLFPYWAGTRWGFNGTTEVPGKGSIACGYFVMTVLRDAGFGLRREHLAQQASEDAISELVEEKNIRRFSRASLAEFLEELKRNGDQLYLVGLDTHIGFLSCENGQCWFIHSSGAYPWCVIREKAETSMVLEKSNYRVTGCLTNDKKFLERWTAAQ